jgi:hypothetical protein
MIVVFDFQNLQNLTTIVGKTSSHFENQIVTRLINFEFYKLI